MNLSSHSFNKSNQTTGAVMAGDVEIVLTAVSALGAIGVTVKYVPQNIKYIVENLSRKSQFASIEKALAFIQKELTANGGGSLKDAVKAIELSLSKTKSMQRLLLDASSEAHWESNSVGEIIWINESTSIVLGYQANDLVGSNWKNVIHPSDKARVTKEWSEVVLEKRNLVIEYRFIKPDRSIVYAKVTADAFIDGWLGTITQMLKEEYASLLESKKD